MIKNLSILITVMLCVQSFAQKTNASPYSVLGIGDGVASETVEEMSMGGIGVASNNDYQLTFSNPASYASLRLTTYALAGQNRAISLTDENGTGKSSNANLSYLAIGIPMGEKGGFVFGLQPSTSVGYSILNDEYDADDELIKRDNYEGSGGTNRVFFGVGYEPIKNLSLGLEGEYIFGSIENTIVSQERGVQFGTKYVADNRIKGFGLKAGVLYKKELKENLFLNIGATVQLESELNSTGNEYLYSVSIVGLGEIPRDTILDVSNTGYYRKPIKTSLGISLGNPNKWSAEVNYSLRNEIELGGNLQNRNPRLAYQKSNKLALGGFYIPKHNSISSYWHRIVYRAGMRVEQTGLMVNGTENTGQFTAVDDFGISFGVGLPMGNQTSRLNFGFEFGRRGTTDNGLVEEEYFNFKLGMTLSSKWFRKRKIN